MNKMRICLVSLGRMGKYRLNQFLARPEKYEVVAFVEPAEALRAWAAEEHPAIPCYESMEAIPAGSQFDGIWCGAPTSAHKAVILAGCAFTKNIYTEKPMGMTAQEATEIHEHCSRSGVNVICGWMRRMDAGFIELKGKSSVSPLKEARLISKDYPDVPIDFLKTLGSIYQDLCCHDFNLALWLMDGQMPISLVAEGIDEKNAEIFTLGKCTLEYPGDVKIHMAGSRFSDRFEVSMNVTLQNGEVHSSGAENPAENFFDRFDPAFNREVDYFYRVMANGIDSEPRVFLQSDDLAVAQLIDMAMRSAELHARVYTNPQPRKMRIARVGAGGFGEFMRENAMEGANADVIEIAASARRRTHTDAQLQELFERQDIDGVYIAAPYPEHPKLVEMCLNAGKMVCCEKPVLDLERLQALAKSKDLPLMVAYHRRFDPEFIKARNYLTYLLETEPAKVDQVIVESQDRGDTSDDNAHWIRCACCHDFDMVRWLFEAYEAEISVEKTTVHGPGEMTFEMKVVLPQLGVTVHPRIVYGRCHPSYLQTVRVNNHTYGYIWTGPVDATTYTPAYINELRYFAQLPIGRGLGGFGDQYLLSQSLMNTAIAQLTQ